MPAVTRRQARNNGVAAMADVAEPGARDGGRGGRGRHTAGRVDREVVGAGGRTVRGGRGARRGGRARPNANRGVDAFRGNEINPRLVGPGTAAMAVQIGGEPRVWYIDPPYFAVGFGYDIPDAVIQDAIGGLYRFGPRYLGHVINPIQIQLPEEDARHMPHPNPNMLRTPSRHDPRSEGQYRCLICMRSYLEWQPTAIPRCGHMFCAECIRGQQEPRCPHCLEAYDPNTLTRIYSN